MNIQYISVFICVAGWTRVVLPVKSNAILAIPATGQINNFQYVNIPAEHQYEFAFNRGSPEHQISRHQLVKDGNFLAKIKWSDTHEGMGSSYFDYNHGNRESITIRANYYEPIAHQHQYQPEYYKSEETASNSELEPDYADFDDRNDEVQTDEPELFDSISKPPPSAVVASALVQQLPKKNIETLFRLPTLSIAQHLLNVYSLVEPQ
ncbi:uncharacterized protein LOC124320561 [Daphnia pulicaria]|uniref:uncharacterized protein LOC124320561 n=1 Tax=Daphnia pulicaria TaxID=35523 RepID=UPI001EE9F430|nr:uncharacterized protein LOC124320561 [Daphnia pulicaria]